MSYIQLLTTEELSKLPLMAIMALSTRCAERQYVLYDLPFSVANRQSHFSSVKNAIQLLKEVSNTAIFPSSEELKATHHQVHRAADVLAASTKKTREDERFTQYPIVRAIDAANVVLNAVELCDILLTATTRIKKSYLERNFALNVASRHIFSLLQQTTWESSVNAITLDYSNLVAATNEGKVTDNVPVPTDLLGPVWGNEEPKWFAKRLQRFNAVVAGEEDKLLSASTKTPIQASLVYAIIDEGFTNEEKALCLNYLSELYRQTGNAAGLTVNSGEQIAFNLAEDGCV